MAWRPAHHKIGACRAHLGAIEQRRDVVWIGVASSLVQAMCDDLNTSVVTTLALVNGSLHIGERHRSSQGQAALCHADSGRRLACRIRSPARATTMRNVAHTAGQIRIANPNIAPGGSWSR